MKRIVTSIVCLCLASLAQAQYASSMRGLLRGLIRISENQCPMLEARLKANPADPLFAKTKIPDDTYHYMCRCMPERTQALIDRLPEEELSKQVEGQEELLAVFKPAVIDTCAAELMRTIYGEHCEANFSALVGAYRQRANEKLDVPGYCSCIRVVVDNMPDSEAADLGLAAADYIPAAAAANKNGTPPPDPPPVWKRFTAANERCGVKMPN